MRQSLLTFLTRFSLIIVVSLYLSFAGVNDEPACTDGNSSVLQPTDTTSGIKEFKKTCLPDANENLKTTLNTRGGIHLIGNQVMCKGVSGYCVDPGPDAQNNGLTNTQMILGDHDDNSSWGVSAGEALKTSTSTMATLNLNSGDSIIKAKLFWMSRNTSANNNFTYMKSVKLLTPNTNGLYIDINCSHFGSENDSQGLNGYNAAYCSADVTQFVNDSGDIWVGNVKGQDDSGYFSAWSMYVVYANKSKAYQNISIYEGFKSFYNTTTASRPKLNIGIDGFLTPETGSFNAALHIFSGESDKNYGDHLTIANKSGTSLLVNNPINGSSTDFLNASISKYGIINKQRNPDFDNSIGIDIDSVAIVDVNGSGILENNQTATTLTFSSEQNGVYSADLLYIPMIALTTELYKPQLCYDYNYGQNGRNFTQENNGTMTPSLVGDVIANDPITLNVYIKNLNNGTNLEKITFSLKDLNTTQLVLDGNITQTDPGLLAYYPVPLSNITATATGVYYKLANAIPYDTGLYTQLELNPLKASIDSPLSMSLNFTIDIHGVKVDYTDFTLDKDVPLCSTSAEYTPEYGVYSILDKALNQNALNLNSSSDLKYNLYTQTSDRNFTTELVSFDPLNLETMKAVNEFIAVELIDAGAYHDFRSACNDPNTKITTRQWLHFAPAPPNADTNLAHMEFIPQDNSFFNASRENVTFRIWRLVGDDNLTGVFTPNANGTASLRNIADTAKSCAPANSNSSTYGHPISDYCLSSDMDFNQQKMCAECLFGYAAEGICSRDNFALRPEAFDIKLFDIDHSLAQGSPQREASKMLQNGYDHNFSAGYNYRFEVNATTHVDSKASPGYTKYFNEGNSDHNATFIWTPLLGHDTTGCNDTSSKSPNFYIKQGKLLDLVNHQERALPNVGRYTLSMNDIGWTKVDQSPSNHVGTHWTPGTDCLLNSNAVPLSSIPSNNTNMGCFISSNHTNTQHPALSTQDQVMTFTPYKFDLQDITLEKDMQNSLVILGGMPSLLYMSDLNNSSHLTPATPMALRFKGKIIPAGEDNSSLSNFVDHCYAQDINISILVDSFAEANTSVPKLQYRMQEQNSSSNLIYDTMAKDFNGGALKQLTVPAQEFNKPEMGIFDSILSINYERASHQPKHIQSFDLLSYEVNCTQPLACQSHADLHNDHLASGLLTTNETLIFGYGRLHAPRYRVKGDTGEIKLYYEVYCEDPAQNGRCTNSLPLGFGLGAESVDDVDWYANSYHDDEPREGNITHYLYPLVSELNSAYDTNGTRTIQVQYDQSKSYPYKVNVRMSTQSWLLYHPFDKDVSTSDFFLEFFQALNTWSGAIKNTKSVDSNVSTTTNRRINW